MIEQDYILLILNCYKYREKALLQKNTWIANLPSNIIYFHVIGNPDLNKNFVYDNENRILFVRCNDDYNSLPKKIFEALMAIYNTYHFKHIFKTDDDQDLINPTFFNTLISVLHNKVPKIHYGGKIINIQRTHISEYYKIHPELPRNIIIKPTKYCNGRFYFLSSESVMNLSNKKNNIYKEYFEDYAIGINLSNFLKTNIMHIDTDKCFKDNILIS
jgi:hypothetical protein